MARGGCVGMSAGAPISAGDRETGVQRRRVRRDVVVVLFAVAAHPSIWWAGLAAVGRMARTRWWRRRPFLPLPGATYWDFRLVTAFGGTGREAEMAGRDVVAYLQWCRRTHPRRG
jgi:hypothetical protein